MHNIELAAWLLRTRMDDNGQPLILSDSIEAKTINLSFERLFGKLIVLQEMMARIAGDATDRQVNTVVHAASRVFIPLPI